MNIKDWRRLAMQSIVLLMIVFVCSICFSNRRWTKTESTVLAEDIQKSKKIHTEKEDAGVLSLGARTLGQSKEGQTLSQEQSLGKSRVVVIDAGHGGMDEGTSSPDKECLEKTYTLLVSNRIKQLLEEENIKVYCTRVSDKSVSKKSRVRLANRERADLFVSIHCNASTVGDYTSHGVEVLYSYRKKSKIKENNKQLAKLLLNSLEESTGLEKRGIIQRDDLYVLHYAKVPAAIVEIGYITNPKDMKYIMKEKGQKEIAQGVCDGILKALEEIE